jgi:hypothetical protein
MPPIPADCRVSANGVGLGRARSMNLAGRECFDPVQDFGRRQSDFLPRSHAFPIAVSRSRN